MRHSNYTINIVKGSVPREKDEFFITCPLVAEFSLLKLRLRLDLKHSAFISFRIITFLKHLAS